MNTSTGKATKLNLLDFKSAPMRAFWITAFAFFMCFFSWFGIVPFMGDVVKDLGLTPGQKWDSILAAVLGTVIARLVIGKLCDKYGPRLCYTWLLTLGAIPVIILGFVQTPEQFIICRFFVGLIGASFVITQFHTSLMFAPNVVGTANATSAGWGNLGGGANRLGMPIIAAAVISCGVAEAEAWRYSMIVAGSICFITGIVYYLFTQDTPEGNYSDLKAQGVEIKRKKDEGSFMMAVKDSRAWVLFLVYAACFGIELTVYGTMDEYLRNAFSIDQNLAGTLVFSFALMNIFARTLGGAFGDKFAKKGGLKGRVKFLIFILMAEGIVLATFSQMSTFWIAFPVLIMFSLCVQMAEGATFSVVPFINKKCTGSISGIVGAGGNVGAIMAAMFLKSLVVPATAGLDGVEKATAASSAVSHGYMVIGFAILVTAAAGFLIKFSKEDEELAKKDWENALAS